MNAERYFKDVFRDATLQAEYERTGYVIVDDFIDAEQIASLTALWNAASHHGEPAFSTSTFWPDKEWRRIADEAIATALAPAANGVFDGFSLYLSGYVAKKPCSDGAGALPVHQDPSFTNEFEWPSARIWAPLCDLTQENGVLYVVPGSHLLNRFPRSLRIAFPYRDLEPLIYSLGVPLYLRAGQAVVSASTLFHFSPANRGSSMRLGVSSVALRSNAPLWYTHGDNSRPDFEIFEVDRSFYSTRDQETVPPYEPIAVCRHYCEPLDADKLKRTVSAATPADLIGVSTR